MSFNLDPFNLFQSKAAFPISYMIRRRKRAPKRRPVPNIPARLFPMNTMDAATGAPLILDNGKLFSWGQAIAVGVGSINDWSARVDTPTEITSNGSLQGITISGIHCGNYFSSVIDASGRLHVWGMDDMSNLIAGNNGFPTVLPGLEGKKIVDIATVRSWDSTFILDSKGTVYALNGDGWYGLLGNGTTNGTVFTVPTSIMSNGSLVGKTVKRVFASNYTGYALDNKGQLHAWGSNDNGAYGDSMANETSYVPVPVQLTGSLVGKTIVDIKGYASTIFLDSDGKVHVVGSDSQPWSSGVPLDTPGLISDVPFELSSYAPLVGKVIVQIETGYRNGGIILDSSGQLHAWGAHIPGIMGLFGNSAYVHDIMGVGSLVGKTIVATAGLSSIIMAIDTNGAVHAWGMNDYNVMQEGLVGQQFNDPLTSFTVPRSLARSYASKNPYIEQAQTKMKEFMLSATGSVSNEPRIVSL